MAQRGRERDRIREEFWRATLQRRHSSGLTVRAFCRRERLHESSYHFWRRELKRRDAESPTSPLGPQALPARAVAKSHDAATGWIGRLRRAATRRGASGDASGANASTDSPRTARFVPVTLAAPGTADVTVPHVVGVGVDLVAEIVLPGAAIVRVARGCDAETLGMVLAVLSSVLSGSGGEESRC